MTETNPFVVANANRRHQDTTAALLFCIEFLTSCGTNFLQVGIFFYTVQRFGWSLRANFTLAAGQGIFYVCGALTAHRLIGRVAPRAALAAIYAAMGLIAVGGAFANSSRALAALLLAYAACSALGWPILEGLLSTGVPTRLLSRRIGIYNLIWSGAGAIVLAINGIILDHWPIGAFLIPAMAHLLCAVTLFVLFRIRRARMRRTGGPLIQILSLPPLQPEPELLPIRTLALWLSRVALPATYVVIYSLMALMPSLPVMQELDETHKTLLGSTWMAARWFTFLVLGLGVWWHARPRILVAAAGLMLLSFAGVVVRPSDLAAGFSVHADLISMSLWQVGVGVALGMIYAASLYFGMVLSDGSTEHGGYHEALIGLGSVLGPGTGAIAQWISPDNLQLGIWSVGGIIALTVVAVFVTSFVAMQKNERQAE